MLKRSMVVTLSMLLALGLAACTMPWSGDSDSDADPQEVLRTAAGAWQNTESAHFKLTVDGDVYLDNNETLKLDSGEGDIKRPGSVKAAAKVDAGMAVVDINMVAVDGEIYITDLLTGAWQRAPQDFTYDPSILFSDTDGVGPMLTALENPVVEAETDVNGVKTHRVKGEVAADRVRAVTAGTMGGDRVAVTVWTAVEDGKLMRVSMTEPDGVRANPATWTLDLTKHNEDVQISLPTT